MSLSQRVSTHIKNHKSCDEVAAQDFNYRTDSAMDHVDVDDDDDVDIILPVGVDDVDENGEIDPRVTDAVIR